MNLFCCFALKNRLPYFIPRSTPKATGNCHRATLFEKNRHPPFSVYDMSGKVDYVWFLFILNSYIYFY